MITFGIKSNNLGPFGSKMAYLGGSVTYQCSKAQCAPLLPFNIFHNLGHFWMAPSRKRRNQRRQRIHINQRNKETNKTEPTKRTQKQNKTQRTKKKTMKLKQSLSNKTQYPPRNIIANNKHIMISLQPDWQLHGLTFGVESFDAVAGVFMDILLAWYFVCTQRHN